MKKNKFFNNSTKGNDTQNQSSKSKRKFLKTFSFSALAVLMGTAGIFAFAPLGASASVAGASAVDQVNTKADGENIKYAPSPLGLDPENDPVIYTTESGLEIKYGGALNYVSNGGGNETVTVSYSTLGSGKPLSGYPYFTMGTYSGYAVNWVIIGKSTSITNSTTTTYDSLTNWQSKTSTSPTYKYFFDNTYEASTPAGSAIKNNNTLSDLTARKLTTNYSALSSIPSNAEITTDCVLAISEFTLGTSRFYSSEMTTANYEGSALKSNINTLYNSSLALTTAQKDMIVAQTLTNAYSTITSSATVSNSNVGNSTSSSQKLFPLACYSAYSSVTDIMAQSFLIENYLTSNALRIAYQIGTTTKIRYYLRGSLAWNHDPFSVMLNGSIASADSTYVEGNPTSSSGSGYDLNSDDVMAMRPACVVKVF